MYECMVIILTHLLLVCKDSAYDDVIQGVLRIYTYDVDTHIYIYTIRNTHDVIVTKHIY